MYGNSDVSKRAYQIQLQREQQIQENAVKKAIEFIKEEKVYEEEAVIENEQIIDENLTDLQETLGVKLTPKMEDEILSIVDEFSPTDEDGKYISLFPFDKAYEIYELRNAKTKQKTVQARNQVADLTGSSSEGSVDSSDSTFERGWDNWRKGL